jgi:hypothetical protein
MCGVSEVSAWLDIATAPKDGTEFLGWGELYEHEIISYKQPKGTLPDLVTHDGITFKGDEWVWETRGDGIVHYSCFTHWMPLPDQPA